MMGAQLDIKGDIEFDIAQATIRDTKGSRDVLNQVPGIHLEGERRHHQAAGRGAHDSDGSAADNQALSRGAPPRW